MATITLSAADKPALLLIDLQKGFDDIPYWGGQRNNPHAEERAGELLKLWREKKLPVYHIKHCSTTPTSPLREGNPGNDFKDLTLPVSGEPIVKKNVNSGFIGTDLQAQLDAAGTK